MAVFRSWKSYWEFKQSVRRNLRYAHTVDTRDFLDAVAETAPSRKLTLPQDRIFWRAQLGHDWEADDVPCAYPPDRMKPLQDRASDGRANPKGIPYLYLATTKRAAMSEVRPWIGSYISVAQFKILKPLEIIDCTRFHNKNPIYVREPSQEEIVNSVWANIDKGFAEPITRGDDTADYVATQIIAEIFKSLGFGGVAYKSSFGEDGYNIALFDINAADLINCGLYRIDSIDIGFSEQENPYFMKKHYERP